MDGKLSVRLSQGEFETLFHMFRGRLGVCPGGLHNFKHLSIEN